MWNLGLQKMNPLINLTDNQCPIHIIISRPGAIAGTDGQREEIAASLPKPMPGKMWVYQPIAAQPLRFATAENADKFMRSLEEKKPTDEYFVPPMIYNQRRQKWGINPEWGAALGELVVFAQVDEELSPKNEPCSK